MAIHLGRILRSASCNQPGSLVWKQTWTIARPRDPYLVLLPVGFAMPLPLPDARCALTAPFHPYLSPLPGVRRFAFCGTFPGVASAGRYPAPCLRGARTFLTMPPVPERIGVIARSSSRLVSRPSSNTVDAHLHRVVAGHAEWAANNASSVATVETSARPSHSCGRKCNWKACTTVAVAVS
jgi:hypothetical protein